MITLKDYKLFAEMIKKMKEINETYLRRMQIVYYTNGKFHDGKSNAVLKRKAKNDRA